MYANEADTAEFLQDQDKRVWHHTRIKGVTVVQTSHETGYRKLIIDIAAIQDQPRQEGAELYFGDEAGVRSDYHSGTSWDSGRRTPVVYTAGNRTSVSMLPAM